MFKYNELSDLKNTTELVTPIELTEDEENVVCIKQDGSRVIIPIEDFDINKTIDERSFIVDDSDDENNIDTSEPVKKSGFVEDSRKAEILSMYGYSYKNLKNVNIWEDFI